MYFQKADVKPFRNHFTFPLFFITKQCLGIVPLVFKQVVWQIKCIDILWIRCVRIAHIAPFTELTLSESYWTMGIMGSSLQNLLTIMRCRILKVRTQWLRDLRSLLEGRGPLASYVSVKTTVINRALDSSGLYSSHWSEHRATILINKSRIRFTTLQESPFTSFGTQVHCHYFQPCAGPKASNS